MIRTYKVAGHLFRIEAADDCPLWDKSVSSYGVFETSETGQSIFTLTLSDGFELQDPHEIYSNKGDVEDGFMTLTVFRNALQIEFRISRIKGSRNDFKLHRGDLLKKVQHMQKDETVFTTGKARKNTVIFPDQTETSDTFARKFADLVGIFSLQRIQFLLLSLPIVQRQLPELLSNFIK